MKAILVLLAVTLYVAAVCGKNLQYKSESDEDSNIQQESLLDIPKSQGRHRRRPRQSFYNHYDYNDDFNGRRRDDMRRDYFNYRQEVVLSQILDKLNELTFYIKQSQSPPPPPVTPPQIVYIPYPISPCPNNTSRPVVPDLPNRVFLEDKYLNWGLVPGYLGLDIKGDGSRPINLNPIEPDEPITKPPPVDHGTTQAGTPKPAIKLGSCKAAVLVCCQDESSVREKLQCFSIYGCSKSTATLDATCQPAAVKQVIAEFADTYAPINSA